MATKKKLGGLEPREYEGLKNDMMEKRGKLAPYERPIIPLKIACHAHDFLRKIGAEVTMDSEYRVNSISSRFPDGNEIQILGGTNEQKIVFSFHANIPKFVVNDEVIKSMKALMRIMAFFVKAGYLDIDRSGGDHATDVVTMRKLCDTSDALTVTTELRRIAGKLGYITTRRKQK